MDYPVSSQPDISIRRKFSSNLRQMNFSPVPQCNRTSPRSVQVFQPRAQLRSSAGERWLQPAEASFLPRCRANAAFLSGILYGLAAMNGCAPDRRAGISYLTAAA